MDRRGEIHIMPKKPVPLTGRQIEALKALDKIRVGLPTTFVNWADADSLVCIGLAISLGAGKYEMTPAGIAALAAHTPKK